DPHHLGDGVDAMAGQVGGPAPGGDLELPGPAVRHLDVEVGGLAVDGGVEGLVPARQEEAGAEPAHVVVDHGRDDQVGPAVDVAVGQGPAGVGHAGDGALHVGEADT